MAFKSDKQRKGFYGSLGNRGKASVRKIEKKTVKFKYGKSYYDVPKYKIDKLNKFKKEWNDEYSDYLKLKHSINPNKKTLKLYGDYADLKYKKMENYEIKEILDKHII